MKYIARCSGGNDSIAMLQMLDEHSLKDVTVTYSETNWGDKSWEARVAEVEAWVLSLGWAFVRVPSIGFEEMVLSQTATGMFPTRIRKFCTKYLKIKPFLKWVAEFDPEKRAIICVGVRRAESKARSGAPAFMPEHDDGRHVWQPIVEFSDADRNAMVAKTPLPLLPHRSKECFCINWNRDDLRNASEDHITRVEALEAKVGRPMFDPKDKMGAVGIREVVRWANSERGQYQAPAEDDFSCEDTWCGS